MSDCGHIKCIQQYVFLPIAQIMVSIWDLDICCAFCHGY